jgi:hypothetical protein
MAGKGVLTIATAAIMVATATNLIVRLIFETIPPFFCYNLKGRLLFDLQNLYSLEEYQRNPARGSMAAVIAADGEGVVL